MKPQLKFLIVSLVIVLVLVASTANATVYLLATDGSDGSDCIGSPCATLARVFDKIRADVGFNAAGHKLRIRTGVYDTVNGIKTANNQDTRLPSGSNGNNFIIEAYPGDCSNNTCENVKLVRHNASWINTLAQIQAGVHAPTKAQCDANNIGSAYPTKCWAGSPNDATCGDSGTLPCLWLRQDSTGEVIPSGVIDLTSVDYNGAHPIKYVTFDGINMDAESVVGNVWSNTSMNSKEPIAQYITFKNLEMKNSVGSCFAQPGIDDHDAQGANNLNHFTFIDVKIHHCGIPFDTYVVPGTGVLAREYYFAKYLHGWYLHLGGNICIRCEMYKSAGNGAGAEASNNEIYQSYIHDNATYGHDLSGDDTIIENNVFYNNGGAELSLRGGVRNRISNNTFVSLDWRGGNDLIGLQINTNFRDSTIENNIIVGSHFNITNHSCFNTGSGCTGTITIRNNLFKTDDSNTSHEIFSFAGTLTLTVSGSISNTDPLFVSAIAPNYAIQTGSAAKDAGFNNGVALDYLSNTRPVGSAIDIGAYEYGGTNVPPTTATLSVAVSGAGSKSISWTGGTNCSPSSPHDTPFNLVCDIGSQVSLTAPMTNLLNWSDCTSASGAVCNATMNTGFTVTANYGSVVTIHLVTANPTSGVTINIRQPGGDPDNAAPLADLDGKTSCLGPCDLRFNSGLVFMLDAPDTLSNGSFFSEWTGCNSPDAIPNASNCHHTATTTATITATFGGNGCRIKKAIAQGDRIEICAPFQQINLYDDWHEAGQFIGTAETGSQGTVTDGPFDFDSDATYVLVNFDVNNTPCAPSSNCHPDGWMAVNNMFKVGAGSPATPMFKLGSGTILIGPGKTFKVQ